MSSTDTTTTASSSRSLPVRRNNTFYKEGRAYLDPASTTVTYPLPVDLLETHRQIMLAQLTTTIFGTLILDRELLDDRPPRRVLDVGCDTAWWSAACHQHLDARGHRVEFVGMDARPPLELDGHCRQLGMRWEYVQHDINQPPWPFPDGSFDLVMARNITLALDSRKYSELVREYARVLRPGGTLELWEHDLTIRSARPRIQQTVCDPAAAGAPATAGLDELGLYPVVDNAHFGPASNACAAQYNAWVTAGLAALRLPTVPCSYIEAMFGAHLVEGSEELDMVHARRLAVPLGAGGVSWERRGDAPRALTAEQEAIRLTAVENFVAMVEAFGPLLREASGRSPTSWDAWMNKARKDWLQDGGFSLGECLELGAWSLKKKESG